MHQTNLTDLVIKYLGLKSGNLHHRKKFSLANFVTFFFVRTVHTLLMEQSLCVCLSSASFS